MKHTLLISSIALFGSALSATAALTIALPGNTTTDGWDQLVGSRVSGYGSHPGTTPWPAPLTPNVAGSDGNASFNKVSGGGYLGTNSFYDGGTSGVLVVSSSNPIADLATLVFQIDMGASSYTSSPQLLVNGSTLLAPDLTSVTAGEYTYSFGPTSSATENHAFQWDLSSFADPITSYEVQWSTAPHSLIYELNLDTGDTFAEAIPEPSTGLLALLASTLLLRRRRVAC